jgi:predicted nuclease of predicted toxin-antitoxin system
MKFLFDQSADFRLIAHLRQLGHDVTAISRDYPHSLADEEVLATARREQRILLVADYSPGQSRIQCRSRSPAGRLGW